MRAPALLLFATACGGGSLEVSPDPLVWDEPIDFHDAEPEECDGEQGGCAPQGLALTNTGTKDLNVRIPDGFDGTTICFVGFPAETPIEIPTLPPGSTYTLQVSVCSYPPGSLTSEVTGVIGLITDGKPERVDVGYAYTPIRDIPVDDSGF